MNKIRGLASAAVVSAAVTLVSVYPVYLVHSFAGKAGSAAHTTFRLMLYEAWLVFVIAFLIVVFVKRHRGKIPMLRFHIPAAVGALAALCVAVWLNLASRTTMVDQLYEDSHWGWPAWFHRRLVFKETGAVWEPSFALEGIYNVLFILLSCAFFYVLICPSVTTPGTIGGLEADNKDDKGEEAPK